MSSRFHRTAIRAVAAIGLAFAVGAGAHAAIVDVTIDGSDAIFLAGRTDVLPIPALNGDPNVFILLRHGFITPDNIVETLPPYIPVAGGDVIRVADPAVGGVDFFNSPPSAWFFGPEGNGVDGSNLSSLGAISGYIGRQGPLAGVFLDDNIPNTGVPPPTLDFSAAGIGRDFLSLSPLLGQVFFIGDGVTSTNVFQQFTAPTGATRLFLGIPDGFGFVGVPGAYDDNNGAYRVRIGVNEIPTIPEPATLALFGLGLAGLGAMRRKKQAS